MGVRGCKTQPGALGTWCFLAALSLGSQATAEGYLLLPSLPSVRALTAGALSSVQPTSP